MIPFEGQKPRGQYLRLAVNLGPKQVEHGEAAQVVVHAKLRLNV